MVWYCMVLYGMAWYGMVWYGIVWYGMGYGMVWYGVTQSGDLIYSNNSVNKFGKEKQLIAVT